MQHPRPTVLPSLMILVAAATACRSAAQDADPARVARLKTLHDAGVRAPLALCPVHLLGRTDANVADALGLVLERRGMPDLRVAAVPFERGDAGWDDVPTRLHDHVVATRKDGDPECWTLYAEFLGDPRKGPTEVRFVVVDAHGDLVAVDRQTPADAAFQRTAGRDPDPLGCAQLVAARLFELAGWDDVSGGVPNGRFAEIWRQKSGGPDATERAAMTTRTATLKKGLADARFAVFAPRWPVPGDVDAGRFAELLHAELGCRTAVPVAGAFDVAASSNQQKRLWTLASAARAAIAATPVDADYVVAADAGLSTDAKSGFVNLVVLTRAGEVVIADFQNDQHPTWKRTAPATLADCERLVARRLRSLLR